MCLYPKLIVNRKYSGTKKNGGKPPTLTDERVRFVPVGCGQCLECRKQKAQQWCVRLHEELKVTKYAYFITLTMSPEGLKSITDKYNIIEVNAVFGKAVRLFLERIRKDYKKSVKHWIITELGQTESERIHGHGILFMEHAINNEWLEKYWKYGNCDTGQYCNSRSIFYITKYMTKIDTKHKNYVPQIFCSAGLGKKYLSNFQKQKHQFNGTDTIEYYTLPNGQRVNLPIYYRNKLFSEEEREKLWINKIEDDTRYVLGVKIDKVLNSSEGYSHYEKALKKAQEKNKELGYGDDSKEWQKMDYNVTLRMLKKKKN